MIPYYPFLSVKDCIMYFIIVNCVTVQCNQKKKKLGGHGSTVLTNSTPNSLISLGGSVVLRLEFSPPTSEAAGSNLGPGPSFWKVGSYLPMPGGLQCSVHWFPPPINYPSQYDPGF